MKTILKLLLGVGLGLVLAAFLWMYTYYSWRDFDLEMIVPAIGLFFGPFIVFVLSARAPTPGGLPDRKSLAAALVRLLLGILIGGLPGILLGRFLDERFALYVWLAGIVLGPYAMIHLMWHRFPGWIPTLKAAALALALGLIGSLIGGFFGFFIGWGWGGEGGAFFGVLVGISLGFYAGLRASSKLLA